MKTKTWITTLVLLAGAFPFLLRGQQAASPPAATGKIGLINIQGAIFGTAEGKKAFADLQAKYKPSRDEITREQQEVASLQDQLQKQQNTLSDDEATRLSRELSDKQRILKQMTDNAQADFTNDRDDIMSRIGKKMVQVIADYAQQNGYRLVIDGAQIPVYYAAKGVDITAVIVQRYDAAHPIVAASATPAAKPPAAKPQK